MSPFEARVRLAVYEWFLETSNAPSLGDLSERSGEPVERVAEALRSLAEQRCLVLEENVSLEGASSGDAMTSSAVRMAMPFSARETDHRVSSGSFNGFANCAWDALGVSVVTGQDAEIFSVCPLQRNEMRVLVEDGRCTSSDVSFVHFALPVTEWWEDIGFT